MDYKTCAGCKKSLPLSEFSLRKFSSGNYGPRFLCRSCFNEKAKTYNKKSREKRYQEKPEKVREEKRVYARNSYWRRREENLKRCAEYYEKYPERRVAYLVRMAVNKGEIEKPTGCPICGRVNCKIEAHHPDYSLPLNVVWACTSCHKKIHRGKINVLLRS